MKKLQKKILVKRPGTGEIKAEDYENLIGKTAATNIEYDTHLSWSQINK